MTKSVAGLTCALLCLVLALIYDRYSTYHFSKERLRNSRVLESLLRIEQSVLVNNSIRVAVGFGACQDVITDALSLLNFMNMFQVPKFIRHIQDIQTIEDVTEIFAYFFQHGIAAERYINNHSLFSELVQVALRLPTTNKSLGGNAPVMASRLRDEGWNVMLGATSSASLKQLISKDIKIVGKELEEDDVHLSFEYKKHSRLDRLTSPRANRFFFHNDVNNPRLKSLDDFRSSLNDFGTDVIVVGGLQMMDSFPFEAGERGKLLKKLNSLLLASPSSRLHHLELASFSQEKCLKDVIESAVRLSDSLGMNEQELPNLVSVLTDGEVQLISEAFPRLATTLDHMREVYKVLHRDGEPHTLTRLHVHTLAYQAILTSHKSVWKNSKQAAAKSSLTAHRHVCRTANIDVFKTLILMDEGFSTSAVNGRRVHFDEAEPVSCWNEAEFRICVAPVLVCTDVVQTGGGGDNVSAAGLVLQL